MSLPEPDISIVRGSREDFEDHPKARDTVLVAEVSDTTLAFDRGRKAADYAAAGVADYWIVNLIHRQIEVLRQPIADRTSPFGWRYAPAQVFKPGDLVAPLEVPTRPIAVSDLVR